MEKKCPYCGASLREEASFCPHCARSINARKQPHPPRYISGRALRSALILLGALAVVLLLALWLHTRPKIYDNGDAAIVYPGSNGDYYLCISKESAPADPIHERLYYYELNNAYRDCLQLYATYVDGGAPATEEFMGNVESVTAEVTCPNEYLSIACTEPQPTGYYPAAATASFLDFDIVFPGEYTAEMVFTITMKNGDIIRLCQKQTYESVDTYTYTPQDAPMGTIEELQALVDAVSTTTKEVDKICLYLPPVVYEGGLVIKDRRVSLVGSTDAGGQRTTFTGTTELSFSRGIPEFSNIDFVGQGQGVGFLASARFQMSGCRVSGWETGILACENSWPAVHESIIEDNGVGLHFNSIEATVSDNFYMGNTFRNNGTAILLESVPNEIELSFPNTRCQGNGTDIDNRCGHELELGEAIFE